MYPEYLISRFAAHGFREDPSQDPDGDISVCKPDHLIKFRCEADAASEANDLVDHFAADVRRYDHPGGPLPTVSAFHGPDAPDASAVGGEETLEL